ncbi:Claspin [Orchesella cincta]|uniref:Claspin n=1 Tax=Orchesella cincta TaxID=48709 RepID=A0A1D2MSV4_ORCCI|nr:Claspin [Orchesella cincta]
MQDQVDEDINMGEEEEANPLSDNVAEEMDIVDSPIKLNSSKTSRRRAVVDSDSESDAPKDNNVEMKNVNEKEDSDAKSDSEIQDVGLQPSSGRARRIIMPEESDSDDATSRKSNELSSKKQSNPSDDDSSSSSSSSSSNSSVTTGQSKKVNKESDSEDELPDIPNPSISTKPSNTFESLTKNSDVYGADSSSEEEERRRYSKAADSDNRSNCSDDGSKSKSKKKKGSKEKRPPQRRASEKAREKTVQELASKTQKMTRESRVSLPYNKPKQLTLEEFLKKRKEAKKGILSTLINSPALGTLRNGISLDNDTEDIVPCDVPSELGVAKGLEVATTTTSIAEVIVNSSTSENDRSITVKSPVDKNDIESVGGETKSETECPVQPTPENSVCNPTVLDSSSVAAPSGIKETNPSDTKPASTDDGELGAIDVDDDEGVGQQHKQKEAELEAYLESMKPKPKRKSIKEMLMSLPGYKDLVALKPKIGGGDKNVISLDEKSCSKDLKRHQKLEELKDRFVRHCITAPTKPVKGEHIKLKINKKEEDSQGIEHLVEGEVEYVRNPLNEDDEALGFLTAPQSASPQNALPGAQRRRLQDMLLGKIRQQKLKDFEERRKTLAMYNDEKDLDEKDILDNEEMEDEISDEEGDSDLGEEEEELEDLLCGTSKEKKKKKKSHFVDDEAEDDDDVDDDQDDEDEDSESSDNDDGDDIEKNDDVASIGISDDSLPSAQVATNKDESQPLFENTENDNNSESIFSADCTPKVTAAVFNQRTPSDLWIPARINSNSRHSMDELSPLIPRIKKASSDNLRYEPTRVSESVVPAALANVISETESKFDDLVDMCSGRFVSQINNTASESQEDDEFGGFDFADDDDVAGNNESSEKAVNTPKTDSSKMAVDGITPKLSEKIPKTRLLMQFDKEAEISSAVTSNAQNAIKDSNNSENNDDDEEEDEITTRTHVRKQKRLQFSDDEDDVNDEEAKNSASEAELSENEEAEEIETLPVEKPKTHGAFFTKDGRLKRKFVEDEAELSGSEEGSDDEDERGLNHYEMEEGDDEEFDENIVKNQAERAHLKQLLDDDDRRIRFLQEKYLENGDLHLDGEDRERRFKWKNMNVIDDDAKMGDSDEEHEVENAEETSQKLAWLEKRKWMSENSHLLEPGEDESQSLFSNSRFMRIGKGTLRKIESCVETSTSESRDVFVKEVSNKKRSIYDEIIKAKAAAAKANSVKGPTSFSEGLILEPIKLDQSSKSMSQPFTDRTSIEQRPTFHAAVKKGSFLSRGGAMLAKLAEITKSGDPVSNVKSNSRNFVFSHITPPNVEKTDGSTSKVKRGTMKAGKNTVQTKKIKVDRCFNNLDDASKEASIFKWL